ncbi:LysM peptidoglycan-binding domain-containing protein [Lysobacter sp. SG-8]|uniref:LysM peptidoglycan-binding domain-containing protein n=1 Tax=Marilutibacter penaei TaxID=2759900 RepID=A0A7W3U221_9GAMM|nr:LysM peptidoglycan-binding domain-containing protein [Lysobacter penaei]
MRKLVRFALVLALLVAHGTAFALGLGEIVVRSRIDQPLLAEIPIISSDPAELEQLQARLASPDTFRRVGLEPPAGLVSDLRFMVALDDAGNPVIRVTSAQPVDTAMLTFLVEVDWGQGRLVREYSALLDAPRTVSSPVQPAIDAPVVSQPNLIEREVLPSEPSPETALTTGAEQVPDDLASEDAPADAGLPAEPTAEEGQVPAAPAPAPARPARPVAVIAGDEYRVERGDTLSDVATRVRGVRGLSMNQTMVALLQANPDAFIDGNVHRLKAGAVLRVPGVDEVFTIEAAEANAIVREQTRQWRQGRMAVPQPAAVDGGERAPLAEGGGQTAGGAVADARLEIVPPGANETAQAGNQSGASAGGEGDMLRQEMQTREELAARDAEITEMKARLSELEDLQQKQAQLIELKDSELAAAQQQLAANAATGQAEAPVMPWILGGVLMLALGLVAGLLMRRRPARAVFRAPSDAVSSRSPLADAFPAGSAVPAAAVGVDPAERSDDLAEEHDVAREDDDRVDDVADNAGDDAVDRDDAAEADAGTDAEIQPLRAVPDMNGLPAGGAGGAEAQARHDAAEEDETAATPAWHTGTSGVGDDDAASAVAGATGGGSERLELARAYIALGDHDSARQLLGEVRVHGDLAARQQAMQMLRGLD